MFLIYFVLTRFTSEDNSTEEDGSDKDFQQVDGAGDTDVGLTIFEK